MSQRYQGGILGVGFNPLQAPDAPTIGTATAGDASATVAFTAPANVGGSAITGYTAQSNPGAFSGAAAGSPITVTGLSIGTAYTFGVFARNSYGPSPISAFSNSVTPPPDGTFGIFALGSVTGSCCSSTTRNKYTYSSCVVGTGGVATVASRCGSAAGNSTNGIFTLGATNTRTTTRNKYTYVGCVVSAATSATVAAFNGSAAGNSTVGIFAVGNTNSLATAVNRNKYTYSGDVVAAGSSASAASYQGAAAGNSTVGIFALGIAYNSSTGYVPVVTRDKYTYSGDVVAAGSAATATSYDSSAAGNSTAGIFALGIANCALASTRNKYTYSGCVVAAGGAATVASANGSAAGNSTIGVFALGSRNTGPVTTRNKYTYSGCVVSAGGAATAASTGGSAAGDGTLGVNI